MSWPLCAAIGAGVCWAMTGIFVRRMSAVALPMLVWQRFALSFLAMLALTRFRRDPVVPAVDGRPADEAGWPARGRQGWADAGLASCMTAYYIFATTGFALGPVALTSLIIALTPAITMGWQLASSRQVAGRDVLGFAVAIVGVCCYLVPLLSGHQQFPRHAIIIAAVAAGLAALVRALFTIVLWNRALRGVPLHAPRVNRLTFLIGAVLLLPVVLIPGAGGGAAWHHLGWLVALVVVATLVPNLLNTWASSRLHPTLNAIVGMLTPPLTGVLGWLWLGESLAGLQWFGMVLTLVGIGVSVLRPAPAQTVRDR
ncbi:DMT family transporter [Acidipropionibacterium jensenii]|uniref:DMT family transporter n=1 Tax=Acidipropionibacterium jensenii TaxID=1749 RepID=UPI00214CA1AE